MAIVQILPFVFSGIQLRPDSLYLVGGLVLIMGQHDYRHFDWSVEYRKSSMLRKSLIMGFVFGFTLFSSIGFEQGLQTSQAQTYTQPYPQQIYSLNEQIWGQMGHSDRVIVDRLAADFYERSLRYAQSTNIEQQTARLYSGAAPAERAYYRNQRRQQWQQMNGNQQQALRNVKRPIFMHLSEAQKWPFRQHALNQLGAAGAIQPGNQTIAGQTVRRGVRPGI